MFMKSHLRLCSLMLCILPTATKAQTVIDLGKFEEDLRVSSHVAFASLGRSLSAGDVNGDGIEDIIGGAEHIPRYYLGGGGAFLIFGSTTLPRLIGLENPDQRVAFWGNGAQDLTGDFVDIFDFSGDGIDDLFLFAPQWIGPDATHHGEGKIFYLQGRQTWPPDITLEDYPDDTFSATLHGERPEAHLGLNHSAHGDFNGDGIADLATCSRLAGRDGSGEQASVYLLWGGQRLVNGPINNPATRHCTIIPPPVTGVPIMVHAANLDDDDCDDVIVILQNQSVDGETVSAGFVLWGRQMWPEIIDLANWQQYSQVTRLVNNRKATHIGTTIITGDFNGSGKPDLALTWRVAGLKPGFVYIYRDVFINNRPQVFDGFDPAYKPVIVSDRHLAHYNFPYTIAGLDWNDDGFDDLVISNSHAYRDISKASEGIVYVVYGSASLPDSIDLRTNNAKWDMIWGGFDNVDLGHSMTRADLDADGKDDLVLGGWTARSNGGLASGELYVLLNRSKDRTQVPPKDFAILPIAPNPFNAQTVIRFDLPNSENIQLAIYDLLGQRVRMLRDGQFPTGRHSAIWNSRDEMGKVSSSGVYFAVLRVGSRIYSRKLLLIR